MKSAEQIYIRSDPPHKLQYSEYATLWLNEDGKPALYSMHLYPGNVEMMTPSTTTDPDQQRRNGWFDIYDWTV
jgi:hypothetical protein